MTLEVNEQEQDDPIQPVDLVDELRQRRALGRSMGGEAGIAKHHASGRSTVRERIDALVDEGSFFELGVLALPEMRRDRPIPADAAVTGYARIDGRDVGLIGIDSSVVAGTTAPISMRKQGNLIAGAQRAGWPIVMLCDADGGRIPDVMGWRFSGLPLDFQTFVQTPPGLPTVPRVAAILGPSYGDSALHASTSHMVVMVASGAIALSGPSVVSSAIGESVDDADLGGPRSAAAIGNVHLVVETEADAFEAVAAFLSYVPPNASVAAPVAAPREPSRPPSDLALMVPADTRIAYDVRDVIECIADAGSILPWADEWGPALVTTLARIEGAPVGVIANQPLVNAGALDPAALTKELKFVELCDTFNLPVVFLQDVPGLLIGTDAERGGILRAYENLVARISNAMVPKVGVVLRKAYGGGHFAMGGRPTHPDFLFAWPSAEMGFMAPETGVVTINRRVLERAMAEGGREAHDQALAALTRDWMADSQPWEAAAHLHLDDVIAPEETRTVIARSLSIAWGPGARVARTK